MDKLLGNIFFFTSRLAGYGLLAGAFFGALIYPLIGMSFGAPIGLVGGIILGVLFGVGITIDDRFFAPQDMQQEEYASRLAISTGLIATVLTALPLAFIFAPVAGFTVAYVAHQYAYQGAAITAPNGKRKNDQLVADVGQRRVGVVRKLTREIFRNSLYVSGTAALLFFIFATLGGGVFGGIGLAIFTLMWGGGFAAIIGVINGFFIAFLNRLIFDDELTKKAYKQRVVITVGVLTLFLSSIVTLGIGAPFAAIAAGFAANKYADWYYDTPEKQKRDKLKNTERLALQDDDFFDDDDWFLEEDNVEDEDSLRLR